MHIQYNITVPQVYNLGKIIDSFKANDKLKQYLFWGILARQVRVYIQFLATLCYHLQFRVVKGKIEIGFFVGVHTGTILDRNDKP